MVFPSYFLVQGVKDLYLCIDDAEKGLLKFSERYIFSPRVKFAVEKSKTGDASLVHIRSCFNKYWVAHEDVHNGEVRVYASANKPQEDTTDPACTLFRVFSDSLPSDEWTFFSISWSMQAADHSGPFRLWDAPITVEYIFRVVDWERLVILPSQVTFRSEHLGGNYLCSRVVDGFNHNSFESELDLGDPRVDYELITTRDGNYRIKSLSYGKLLRKIDPEWIVVDAEDNNNSDDTLFSFIKVSNNVVALSCCANNRLCGGAGAHNCLSASYSEVSKETRLIVEERVLKRKISNVRYRLDHSIFFDEQFKRLLVNLQQIIAPTKITQPP